MINIFQPDTGIDESIAVNKVLDSKWIGRGKIVKSFVEKFSETKTANKSQFCPVNSCTQGLFIAASFFNFGPGDEIIVPTISFNAVGNLVVASGAKLVLCDVDCRSLNTNAELIQKKITSKTKALIINHYGGVPCNMDPILEICQSNNILLIEDAACCPYSFYKNKSVGTFGDFGAWSFDAMKIITTGDGGMIYLDGKHDIKKLERLTYMGLDSSSGIDKKERNEGKWWEFQVHEAANRCVMNDISASIGIVQLSRLKDKIRKRSEIHNIYNESLADVGDLLLPEVISDYVKSSYYFYWIQTRKRDALAVYLKDNGIYSTFRYYPLNKIKFFKKYMDEDNSYINSDNASDVTLCIPIHESLSVNDVEYIIDKIKKFYE